MTERKHADWTGVGDSFKALGEVLKRRSSQAGDAVRSASDRSTGVEQITAVFKTAVDQLDQTSTDPQVARAAKDATARFLDAVKVELTGEDDGSGAAGGHGSSGGEGSTGEHSDPAAPGSAGGPGAPGSGPT